MRNSLKYYYIYAHILNTLTFDQVRSIDHSLTVNFNGQTNKSDYLPTTYLARDILPAILAFNKFYIWSQKIYNFVVDSSKQRANFKLYKRILISLFNQATSMKYSLRCNLKIPLIASFLANADSDTEPN